MSITNYGELKQAVADWLDRPNLTAEIPDFITFAQRRIHFGHGQGALGLDPIRVRAMETETVLSASSEKVALPSDFLESRRLILEGSPRVVLPILPTERFWRQAGSDENGKPRRATIEIDNLVLHPAPDSEHSLNLLYYASFPALSADEDTNWLLQNAPDLYLFGSLVEANVFTRNLGAAEDYLLRYAHAAFQINRSDARARSAGSSWTIQAEGVV